MNLKRYNKLWACMLSMLVMVILNERGITLPGLDQVVTNMMVGLLGSWGVYQVRNEY